MKKHIIAAVALLSCSIHAHAQMDSIYLHNHTAIAGTVLRVTEYTVVFRYADEDAEQSYGKYAVWKVVYGKSKRKQKITPKYIVNGEEDWDNVIIIENTEEIAGLHRVDEVMGKSARINYRTGAGSDKVALRRIKQHAAELGCPFVLITEDKDKNYEKWGTSHNTQTIKRAIAYSY